MIDWPAMPPRVARRPAPPAVKRQQLIVDALGKLPPAQLAAALRAVTDACRRQEVTYIRKVGQVDVIRLLPVPVVLASSDVEYLKRLIPVLVGAHRKIAVARARDAELQAVLPLDPVEEEWLALAPPVGSAPLVARWDMNIDPARGGARAATLFELNGCAIGGLLYAAESAAITAEHVVPLAPGRPLYQLDGLGALWWKLAVAHARALGRSGTRIAWLEDRSWETGITEGPSLVARLVSEGQGAVVADPRDLVVDGDEIRYHGLPLDVVYRNIELRDLVEIEAEHGPLTGMREAVRRNLVVSPLEGDLDHKSLLEVMSSRRFARLFDAAERAAFRRHVPWTRLLSARYTDGPDGREVDLPEYTRRHRARLVIKPNRACGGDGVLLGRDTKATAWERAIARALSGREPAVVQALVESATTRTVVVRGRRTALEEHFTTYGVMGTADGLGILGRAAPFPVVNVSRGGGLLGVLRL